MDIGMLVDQCLAPVPGGTGRYAAEITRALAAVAEPEDGVATWTGWHRDLSAAVVPGVGAPRRLPLPRRGLTLAWERWDRPRPASVDVLHAPTLLAPLGGRTPVVVTVHDVVPWTHPDTLTPRGARWHRRAGERAARLASALVVPTRAVADELAQHLELRCRVEVIGEGVSPLLSPPADRVDRRDRLGVHAGGYLLAIATLEPRKGLDVLLDALGRPDAPELPLLVVGQPGWGDAAAYQRSSGPAARFLGRLGDADLAALIDGAAAVVVPSRAEGFGLPVLEGMAAGVPVITSDAPALVEVGGGATLVTPVGDAGALAHALRRVLVDQALRAELIRLGNRRALAYSWERAAGLLWTLYHELADDPGSARPDPPAGSSEPVAERPGRHRVAHR